MLLRCECAQVYFMRVFRVSVVRFNLLYLFNSYICNLWQPLEI